MTEEMAGGHSPIYRVGWIFLLYGLQLIEAESESGDVQTVVCDPGFYYPNCTGVCHCLNGVEQCHPSDGICADYQCQRGWMNSPYCNVECDDGFFGSECLKECHCQAGISCLKSNGACENNACHAEWVGSACQLRLPKLISPPMVGDSNCTALSLTWARWQEDRDIGSSEVASYTVQMRSNSGEWEKVGTIDNAMDSPLLNYTISDLVNDTTYEFRIVSNLEDFGKMVVGLPGPASKAHTPDCTEPHALETTVDSATTTAENVMTTVAMTTRAQNQVPSEVQNVRQNQNSSGKVIIEWDKPTDVGDLFVGYNFTFQALGTGDCNRTSVRPAVYVALQHTRASYALVFAELEPWTKYMFEIRAQNVHGQGASVGGEFMTPVQVPKGVVQKLRQTSVGTTEVTLEWDAVPCALRGGSLVHYDVIVRDFARNVRFMQQQTTQRTFHIADLAPYWRYAVSVGYVNSKGTGPFTKEYMLTTKEDVPTVPRQVMIKHSTDTTLKVSWLPPEPANGIILEYRIVYWDETSPEVKHSASLEATTQTTKVIGDLMPFTRYFIQVSARTGTVINSGWSNATEPISYVTKDGRPSMAGSFNRTFRNESCISVSWTQPLMKNGIISSYRFTYKQVDADSNEHSSDIPADRSQFTVCSLLPATLYRLGIMAKTRAAYGPVAQLDVWTEVDAPLKPATPKILNYNETIISISIKPVELRRGPISGYFVVVSPMENGRRRKKRALPDPVVFITGLIGYTAAGLTPEDLNANTHFIIGDDRLYGGYRNVPLQRDTDFLIVFVVVSSLDGVVKMSMSQVLSSTKRRPVTRSKTVPVITTTTKPVSLVATTAQALAAEDDKTVLVIAIVIPLLLLIMILAAILAYRFMKKREKKVQANEKRSAWLNYYTANFSETETENVTKPGKWSDIYELNASRVPIYNETYTVVDLKVSDIYHNKPEISFDAEYRKLPHSSQCTSRVAELRQNQNKNRFDHLLAYDHSRVVLADEQPGSTDYINANYIHGYECRNAYIAAQSPFNDVTICDFWQMIYQDRVSQVVFLGQLEEDGVVKSERYWPENDTAQQYGEMMVSLVGIASFATFTVREFDILTDGTIRRVTHYQFLGWPEHGVPDDPVPLLEFRERVRTSAPEHDDAPILVHCGTGVSRSAVFIALDTLLQQAKVENAVNVFNFCNKMRRNRVMMVRTLKQYTFIYDLLFEALITTYNVLGVDLKLNYRQLSRINPTSNTSYFREQFDTLERFVDPVPPERCVSALREGNVDKNRFSSIAAPDTYRPVLQTPGGLGRTDYINALYIDGYHQKNRFIVTQTPLASTVIDFWKLVYDYNISTIVTLNGSDFAEDSCAEFWPSSQAVQRVDPFFVKPLATEATDHITVRSAQLCTGQKPSETARLVRQFRFEAWRMYENVPWSREAFLDLIERVARAQDEGARPGAPILVHCMDGASQSGLFCACAIACEKMQTDQQVDVFHTIKHMKRRRPHFVNSLEQYKFCFKLLWDFLNTRMNITPTDINEPSSHWL